MNDTTATPKTVTFSGDLSVTELTGILKHLIEESLPVVSVTGELSNYVHHSSGHRYFTLKDEGSQLRCMMFKWQAGKLDFEPSDGMMVRAVGSVTVYERGGQYQLSVVRLQPLGRGDLLLRLEELKKRLADEGVFVNERPLPRFPLTVGIVTSPTGAAVRDIISIIRRRAPYVRIILRPTLVQGEGAADDIVCAIEDLNRFGNIDVLIVGRGGGSIEDLWCFNEERVARAITASELPVVSAVGHETDFTLSDFAADLRAPTPSAAAELVVRDNVELVGRLESYRSALRRELLGMFDRFGRRIDLVRAGLSPARFQRDIMMRSQQVDEGAMRLVHTFDRFLTGLDNDVRRLGGSLAVLNPRQVLDRGYAIVTGGLDGAIITDSSMVNSGDEILIDLARGGIEARVEEIHG